MCIVMKGSFTNSNSPHSPSFQTARMWQLTSEKPNPSFSQSMSFLGIFHFP